MGWEKKLRRPMKHPTLPGAEIKYGGRTLSLQVVINTDEPLPAVVARLNAAAKGPHQAMVAVLGPGELEPEEAEVLWRDVWSRTAAVLGNRN